MFPSHTMFAAPILMLSAIKKCDESFQNVCEDAYLSWEKAVGSVVVCEAPELLSCFAVCQSPLCQPMFSLADQVLSKYHGRRNHLGKRNTTASSI